MHRPFKLRLQTLQQVHCFFYTYIDLLEEKIEGIHNDNVDLMMMMMFSLHTSPDLTSGNEDESTSDGDSSEDDREAM